MQEESYATIREFLGCLIGRRLVDVTQHDQEDWIERRDAFFCLMFDDGATLTVRIGDEGSFTVDAPGNEPEEFLHPGS